MRSFIAFASFAAALGLAACGGATTSDLFQDASSGDGSSSSDSGTSDATRDAKPDTGPAPNCNALIADVANKRDKAVECNPGSNEAQCTALVADLCCPISVTNAGRKEVQEFSAAVEAAKKSGCTSACPAIVCPTTPSGKCDPKNARCL
jgi:hypothetical protein